MEKTAVEIAAKKFLKKGIIANINENELATACIQLINSVSRGSIKSGWRLSREFLKQAEGQGEILELAACKTVARLTHMSGAHAEALPFYLKAYRLARSQPVEKARIDRALVDVYMYLGKFSKSRQSARKAIAAFRKIKSESDLIMTEINYANLLHRQDKHKDAERLYRKGAEYFEKSGNRLAAARCNYNRANTLVQLFELDTAIKLYEQALQVYSEADYSIEANDARYGLAWLNMLTGKFHTAMQNLLTCQKIYHEVGDPRGEGLCILDLAEVYLGLGLYTDAIEAAQKSLKIFSGLKLRYESAKASLFLGQAALSLGKKKTAYKAYILASDSFRQDKNCGFLGVTHLLGADLMSGNQKLKRARIKCARSCFSRSQLPLWEAVSDLRDAIDPRLARKALKKVAHNRAAYNVPHLHSLWQIASGDNHAREGNLSAARQCWQKAADRLDLVRAQLPPVELRNAFGRKQSSPHLRLISDGLNHSLTDASAWLERYKTAGIWSALPATAEFQDKRKAAEESLRLLANQVAALAGQLTFQSSHRNIPAITTHRTITNLQRQIREKFLELEDSSGSSIGSIEQLIQDFKTVSYQMPIIQFHQQANDIIAFIHSDGELSARRYAGGAEYLKDALRRWRFILEGELLSEQMKDTWDYGPEQVLWSQLGEYLWKPLGIGSGKTRIMILPEGDIANLPWQALTVDGRALGDYHHFIISPSLRHFMAAAKLEFNSEKIDVFRGAAKSLPKINEEIELFKKRAGDDLVVHSPCRRDDWPSSGEAKVWHFAGHSIMRADNPFYSHLLLDDGPLFAADFRIKRCRVGLVTLATCRSGEQVSVPGEESTGLVRSLLEMGAQNVIASRWPVSDRTTSLWMQKFYDKFFENYDILQSSRYAAESVKAEYPSAYHWAAFTVFGAGSLGGRYEN